MADRLYVLIEVTGCESEQAAVAAIENLNNSDQGFEVLESVLDDGGTPDAPTIYFP